MADSIEADFHPKLITKSKTKEDKYNGGKNAVKAKESKGESIYLSIDRKYAKYSINQYP